MMGVGFIGTARATATAAASLVVLVACAVLAACTVSQTPEPPPSDTAAQAPPPQPTPPPVDLAGKWTLSAAGGSSCLMTFGDTPGTDHGTIQPAGGCPGNFFTSRKWAFENNALIIRDFKGNSLAQLSFAADHFEGQGPNGAALTLSR
jgi:hypothetical protein